MADFVVVLIWYMSGMPEKLQGAHSRNVCRTYAERGVECPFCKTYAEREAAMEERSYG